MATEAQQNLFSQASMQEANSFFSMQYSGAVNEQLEAKQIGPVLAGPGAKREQKLCAPPKLSYSQKDAVQRAKKYAMEQSIKTVLLKQTITHQQQQMINMQTSVQRQQALALMCRVYVGTINFEIKEDTVKQAFIPFGPIKSISLPYDMISKKHKGFAFIEYDIPEAASLALDQMNGVMIGGFSIKVGRPSNMPQAQPIIEKILEESKQFNRIYVASIHQDLTEQDIRSVFEAFGRIVYCKLATDPMRPGKHKGYGYIEYDGPQSASDAVSAMNLFDLGGQYLRVGKAVTPPNASQVPVIQSSLPTASAIAAAAVTAKITALEAVNKPITPGIAELAPPPPPPVGVVIPQLATPLAPPSFTPSTVQTPFLPNNPGIPVAMPPMAPANTSVPLGFPPVNMVYPTSLATGGIGSLPMANPGILPPPTVFVPPVATLPAAFPLPQNPAAQFGSAAAQFGSAGAQFGSAASQPVMTELPEPQQTLQQQEDIQIKGHQARHMVMQKLMRKSQSRVMILRNMVGPEDIDEDLENEVTDECSKYGNVERVIIYQEKQGEEEYAPVFVKLFVEFQSSKEMEAAVSSLNGRFFGGRTVQAAPYDQEMFEDNDLSA